MMPQPPQRPARMPSGPSPTIGGGMPNRTDMLRQQAERTAPSMPLKPAMGGGAPQGGISDLKVASMGAPKSAATPPPSAMGGGAPSMSPMGNAPMDMGMGDTEDDGPGEQDLVVGIAMAASEVAGGEPTQAIALLDQAKDLLMQQVGGENGGGEPDMDRLAAILGGAGGMMA